MPDQSATPQTATAGGADQAVAILLLVPGLIAVVGTRGHRLVDRSPDLHRESSEAGVAIATFEPALSLLIVLVGTVVRLSRRRPAAWVPAVRWPAWCRSG